MELGITVFLHPRIRVLDALSIKALQSSRESYLELLGFTYIELTPEHPVKA